jgi:hypothetical protein
MATIHLFFMTFFLLLGWHALADYPLQGDFIAKAKSPFTDLGKPIWKWVLPSHAFIHGVGVTIVTGSLVLGLLEVVCHGVIDYLKCAGKISFNTDQTLHVFCKFWWTVVAVFFLAN